MPTTLSTTPRADGFRMPGEFEPHAGCWMLFPERTDVWRDGAKPAQAAFSAVARAISRFEPVTVCASAACYQTARNMLPPQVRVLEMSSNDAWMRDVGPSFVVSDGGDVRGVDWEFNAWGGLMSGLYYPWDADNQVAQKVLEAERVDRYKSSLVNEGGAIHVDGQGTLITTRSVLLNPNRNPNLSQGEVEQQLADYLNLQKIIWLDVPGDDETDGHIDGVCCFARPGVVLLSWTDEKSSADYDVCRSVLEQLRSEKDASGRTLEIIKLPLANLPPVTKTEAATIERKEGTLPREVGEPVFGGYINFYIANGGVIVPQFGTAEDAAVLQVLQEAFPSREVVGVPNAREISLGGGNIHCITQQQPR